MTLNEALDAREAALLTAIKQLCPAPDGRSLVWFQPLTIEVPTQADGTEGTLTLTMPRDFEVAHVVGWSPVSLDAIEFGYYPDSDDGQARAEFLSLEAEGSAVTFPRASAQLVERIADIRPGQPRMWEGRQFKKNDKVTLVARDKSGADDAFPLVITIIARMRVCR